MAAATGDAHGGAHSGAPAAAMGSAPGGTPAPATAGARERAPAAATVVALHLNVGSRQPLAAVARVNALREQGLEGDRHARPNHRRSVLLMEQEVLDQFGLPPGAVREQVTVRGLALNGLAFGARLGIGGAVLEVAGPCAPCQRMNELQPGLKDRLQGRRGRFARVVEAGPLAVGDPITLLPPVPPTA